MAQCPRAVSDTSPTAYGPTSLDFINLPNPIEPYAGPQRHPLNGTPRLEKARPEATANQAHFMLILEDDPGRSAKRQKTTDSPHLDLPKLPVRNGPKRPRIPPTLSGLHQPPPDAGLLPSISVDKPVKSSLSLQELPQSKSASQVPIASTNSGASCAALERTTRVEKKRIKRNKWSDGETECLLKGVARFGIGNWTMILKCADYSFPRRTALDLKDRFRVCCPEQYKKPTKDCSEGFDTKMRDRSTSEQKPSHISSSRLRELGIDEPFVKTERRSRHGYSAAEDEALLQGFKKHGNQWALIKQDAELELAGRRPTDLRDRFRTRFADQFGKVGSFSKIKKSFAVSERLPHGVPSSSHIIGPEQDVVSEPARWNLPPKVEISTAAVIPPIINKDDSKDGSSRRAPQPSLFSLDDVFMGAVFGTEDQEAESEPIVLDRGILDWANGDTVKASSTEPSRTGGIDPLMTLKLPKPHASLQNPTTAMQQPAPVSNTTSLPSLSTIFPDATTSEQYELPSLMTWLGPMEAEGRNGGIIFQSLEELFS